jgi:hypothetical protein
MVGPPVLAGALGDLVAAMALWTRGVATCVGRPWYGRSSRPPTRSGVPQRLTLGKGSRWAKPFPGGTAETCPAGSTPMNGRYVGNLTAGLLALSTASANWRKLATDFVSRGGCAKLRLARTTPPLLESEAGTSRDQRT